MCIKNENKNLKKAFSLIELLISLITISVILASMAPIITHKLKHGGVSISQGGIITNKCEKFSSDCQLCTSNKCLICSKTCPNGQFVDKDTCSCKNCSDNCAACSESGCDKCNAGYQKSGNSCTACPTGQYSSEGGTCQKCPKGSKANASSAATGCTSCDGNKEYQDEEGKTSCKTCNPGFVTDSNRACKTCTAGTYWDGNSCKKCQVGYYSNNANVTSCTPCEAGTYQDKTGETSCKACNEQQYQDEDGMPVCKDCPLDLFVNSTHTECLPLKECPNGKFTDKETNTCKDCPEGCLSCDDLKSCNYCEPPKNNSYETTTMLSYDNPEYLLDDGVCKRYKKPNSQEVCNKLTNNTTIYVPDDYTNPSNGGFCMNKRNAGDLGGPSIDYTGSIYIYESSDVNSNYSHDYSLACSYGYSGRSDKKQMATAKINTDANGIEYCSATPGDIRVNKNISKFDYEGCNRTLCGWNAADFICRNISPDNKKMLWNLPTLHNLYSLKDAIEHGPENKDTATFDAIPRIQKWSGASGLQLCQRDSSANSAGSPRCDYALRHFPNVIWGRKTFNNNTYGTCTLDLKGSNPIIQENKSSDTLVSVRCVMYKYIED